MKYNSTFRLRGHLTKTVFILILTIIISFGCQSPSGKGGDLESGFMNPPESAKPRVWWHWMNGNITKEGIRADLEWMHRVGIGGFQNFDASLSTPQIVEKRLIYMTPEWKEAFRFTAQLADSLGLEMAIAGSPGWSESGGPWVEPAQAMKKYVWSETPVTGGTTFSGTLPEPPSVAGPFMNIPIRRWTSSKGNKDERAPAFYADAAVIAFPVPASEMVTASTDVKITSSGEKLDLKNLTDGDLTTSVPLQAAQPGQSAWVRFEYAQPVTIRSLTIGGGTQGSIRGVDADRIFEAGDDGITYRKVTNFRPGGAGRRTITFAPVTARFFRFCWNTPQPVPPAPGTPSPAVAGAAKVPPPPIDITELSLHQATRINRFEEKSAFATATDLYKNPTPAAEADEIIPKAGIVDLTAMMKPDGSLEWTAPAGNWVIMRLGYSLTGHQNSPASPEATGLEVDKLNAAHVKAYFNNYLDQYVDATGGLTGRKGLKYVITDSWEAGVQNWTDNMIPEFTRRRGYDMIPWLPVLTGRLVESAGSSDRFLWDFRKTIADLTTENHYDLLTSLLKERKMERYTESHEGGRAFIGDGMEVKRKAGIPMSATWTPRVASEQPADVANRYKADVRESASVAHIYGQNLVAAESMTAIGTAWAWSPEYLKSTADMELASGLNRFVIHTSVHQPVNDKIPGLGLGPYGQWFTRHETWAEQAGPWITYLSRSCYMLQQGKFVADILCYYGEDNNITALYNEKMPAIPEGFNYDFVNADALVNVLSVNKGNITTPGGTDYRILMIDSNAVYMSLPVLRKLETMLNAGAVVTGPKPLQSPSLSDNGDQFTAIVDRLWANEKGINVIGKGKLFAGMSLPEVLQSLNIRPDFEYSRPAGGTPLLFVHRRAGDTEIYWVNSRSSAAEEVEATFRVTGKIPEIWHPETGKIEQASFSIGGESTKVMLHLQPNDAVFVVFRHKATEKSVTLPPVVEHTVASVDGPWGISFQPNRGAPEKIAADTLFSWSDHAEPGVKYFSGTGTYKATFTAPDEWFNQESEIVLDLGKVKNLAEVVLNGKSTGIIWKSPFRVDVSGSLVKGENTLEIRVTNLWVNRLIGDQQPDMSSKITYTTIPFYKADSPLLPSGLLGPVKLIQTTKKS